MFELFRAEILQFDSKIKEIQDLVFENPKIVKSKIYPLFQELALKYKLVFEKHTKIEMYLNIFINIKNLGILDMLLDLPKI